MKTQMNSVPDAELIEDTQLPDGTIRRWRIPVGKKSVTCQASQRSVGENAVWELVKILEEQITDREVALIRRAFYEPEEKVAWMRFLPEKDPLWPSDEPDCCALLLRVVVDGKEADPAPAIIRTWKGKPRYCTRKAKARAPVNTADSADAPGSDNVNGQ